MGMAQIKRTKEYKIGVATGIKSALTKNWQYKTKGMKRKRRGRRRPKH